jgi:DNA-binding MarR family transcriptional regulator
MTKRCAASWKSVFEFEYTEQKISPRADGSRAEINVIENLDDELRRAGAAQRLAMERALATLDLTPAQFAMMEWLEREPGLSGAEFARRERITPPTSSVIVANLERKGLVTRKRSASAGRAQRLELTLLGRTAVVEGQNAVAEVRKRLAVGLDPAHFQALLRWLKSVSHVEL